MATYISSLVIGAFGFLWPGGPNILMIMGAVMLFGAAILDESETDKQTGQTAIPGDLEDDIHGSE